jgi:hypothetical protein
MYIYLYVYVYIHIYIYIGATSLNGECFAWLDEGGTLRIYGGNPDYPNHTRPIWSSGPPKEDIYSSYFQRFYLELSSTGKS